MGLTVATWNLGLLQVGPARLPMFQFAPHVDARASVQADLICRSDLDILAVQECFGSARRDRLTEQLADHLPVAATSPSQRLRPLDAGLMVAGRLACRNPSIERLGARLVDEAIFASPSLQRVEVRTPAGQWIAVYNTHTTAGGIFRHPESRRAEAVRARQFRQIIARAAADPLPAIVCGDINASPRVSPANFELFEQAGFIDAVQEAADPSFAPVTWEQRNPLNIDSPHATSPDQRIDHILLTPALRRILRPTRSRRLFDEPVALPGVDRPLTASDHYGIAVRLEEE